MNVKINVMYILYVLYFEKLGYKYHILDMFSFFLIFVTHVPTEDLSIFIIYF